VYDVVEKMPVFPGGNVQAYIAQHLKYPDGAGEICVQGRVIVSFVIEKDGSISNAKVERSLDPLFDKEAMRMVSGMPRWQPGRQNGKPVRVRYTLPVTFRLV
jgi:TonB family protein